MPDTIVKKRVHRLEKLMEQLITTVDRVDQQIEHTQRNLDQLLQEHREFKDEMSRFRRESRKQWGELSNKLGTMAENLVAPGTEHILLRYGERLGLILLGFGEDSDGCLKSTGIYPRYF